MKQGSTLVVVLVATVLLFSACYKNQSKSLGSETQQISSVCDENQMRLTLTELVNKWGTFPSYVAKSVLHTAKKCFGGPGLRIELELISEEKKKKAALIARKRSRELAWVDGDPGDKDPWRLYTMDSLANLLKFTGEVGKIGLIAFAPEAGPFTSYSVNTATDVITGSLRAMHNAELETATLWSKALLDSGKYDLSRAANVSSNGKNPHEKRDLFTGDIIKQVKERPLAPGETEMDRWREYRALSLGAGSAYLYGDYHRLKLQQLGANGSLENLSQSFQKIEESKNQATADLNVSFGEWGKRLRDHGRNFQDQMKNGNAKAILALGSRTPNMNNRDLASAVQDSNYGDLSPEERRGAVWYFLSFDSILGLIDNTKPFARKLDDLSGILRNLNLDSQPIDELIKNLNGVYLASSGIHDLYAGEYLSGLRKLTTLLGLSKQTDVEGERFKVTVGLFNKVIELQMLTIKLQLATLDYLQSLAKTLDETDKVNKRQQIKAIRLAQMIWGTQHFERGPFVRFKCDRLLANLNYVSLKPEISNLGVPTILEDFSGEKVDAISLIASATPSLPELDIADLVEAAKLTDTRDATSGDCLKNVTDEYFKLVVAYDHMDSRNGTNLDRFSSEASELYQIGSERPTEVLSSEPIKKAMEAFFRATGIIEKDFSLDLDVSLRTLAPIRRYQDVGPRDELVRAKGFEVKEHMSKFEKDKYQRFQKNLFKSSILDPEKIVYTIRHFLDFYPISMVINTERTFGNDLIKLFGTGLNTYEQDLERMLEIVEFTIAQQTLFSGDAVLDKLDEAFILESPPASKNGSTNIQLGSPGGGRKTITAYAWISISPQVKSNFFRYKLRKVFQNKSSMTYEILYRMFGRGKEGQQLSLNSWNNLLAEQGLELYYHGEDDYRLRIKDKRYDDTNYPIGFNIELPIPSEFFGDQMIHDPALNSLIVLRERIKAEIRYAGQSKLIAQTGEPFDRAFKIIKEGTW